MMNSVSEDGTGDAIVYVPVSQRLLPEVYRVLALAMTDPAAAVRARMGGQPIAT